MSEPETPHTLRAGAQHEGQNALWDHGTVCESFICFPICKGGGWAFALEAAKTCLELLNQQSRRGKQVPLSLSALELKEVFSQLAPWIWFPLHQNTSAINNFRHNASTRHSHTPMWPKSFLSMTVVRIAATLTGSFHQIRPWLQCCC